MAAVMSGLQWFTVDELTAATMVAQSSEPKRIWDMYALKTNLVPVAKVMATSIILRPAMMPGVLGVYV